MSGENMEFIKSQKLNVLSGFSEWLTEEHKKMIYESGGVERINITTKTFGDIGLVRQPYGLSPKSCKMHGILLFLSRSCSKTEVFEQLYYEKLSRYKNNRFYVA
jgi:hypothetical protein